MSSHTNTLLVLTLNEIDGMRAIMPKVPHELFSQILVVDGGSNDGTPEWARTQGYEVYTQQRKGLRNAYIEALPLIRGEVVVAFSPDGNSLPEALAPLLAKIAEGYDVVTASRYLDHAKSDDDGPITGLGNWAFTALINLLYGGRFTDAMVMYRAIRKSVFSRLDLDQESSYWPEKWVGTPICLMPLLSIRTARARLPYAEIPADEPKRLGGVRKLQIIRWGSAYLLQVIFDRFFWKPWSK